MDINIFKKKWKDRKGEIKTLQLARKFKSFGLGFSVDFGSSILVSSVDVLWVNIHLGLWLLTYHRVRVPKLMLEDPIAKQTIIKRGALRLLGGKKNG